MIVVNRSSFLFSFLCKERGQGQRSLLIHFGSSYAHSFAIHVLGYDTQHSCCGNTEMDHVTINFVRSNASNVRAQSRYKQMLCSKVRERERDRHLEKMHHRKPLQFCCSKQTCSPNSQKSAKKIQTIICKKKVSRIIGIISVITLSSKQTRKHASVFLCVSLSHHYC